ncbi:MAG: SulP family inorganic anion transporter [Flavobacteriaceae bacterium]
MKLNKSIIHTVRSIPKNMFSGLAVSLIALPLSLGLAMACDAPPVAGVITSIVGGIVVAALGGSFVTISGPGKGLVGVVLVAVSSLGLNATFAAIICSGVLLLVLGFLRLGKLADYFPSSAIQGVLAAIGLIILGKQFHIMMGNKILKNTTIEYLLAIPETLVFTFHNEDPGLTNAAIAGVLSLMLLIFYSKIRNKYLQLVPAPMWIVICSIGFSYYFELILKIPNPISPEYMMPSIPSLAEVLNDLPTPDFSWISRVEFWSSVIALTLIASIESLLSIKAVDKLDPRKRRSNVNRDIKALGAATALSGFMGGLNVVTVIAPSSVNISNGGSNRLGNLFHALFLTLFILLFSAELARIPLSALMAILVYTGYKLAAPKMLKRLFLIGKEQIIIFLSTLVVTLQIGLISGITAGLMSTFIIHILVNKSILLFVKNVLKPNVLMYKEDNGNYFISVKHFCSFLNFNNLKDKLSVIPEQNDVVIDFSMCAFVDHSVMENINDFQELFYKKGGTIEVIGMDLLGASSGHPFALRRMLPFSNIMSGGSTKRENDLRLMGESFDLSFNEEQILNSKRLESFLFFRTKKIEYTHNTLSRLDGKLIMFDINFSEGEFIAKEVVRSTMLYIELSKNIPEFALTKEGLLERLYVLAGQKDINIPEYDDFSSRFYLSGGNPKMIRQFFSDNIIRFFESNPYFHVESNGNGLLIFSKERIASIKEIKQLLDFGMRLEAKISEP